MNGEPGPPDRWILMTCPTCGHIYVIRGYHEDALTMCPYCGADPPPKKHRLYDYRLRRPGT